MENRACQVLPKTLRKYFKSSDSKTDLETEHRACQVLSQVRAASISKELDRAARPKRSHIQQSLTSTGNFLGMPSSTKTKSEDCKLLCSEHTLSRPLSLLTLPTSPAGKHRPFNERVRHNSVRPAVCWPCLAPPCLPLSLSTSAAPDPSSSPTPNRAPNLAKQ